MKIIKTFTVGAVLLSALNAYAVEFRRAKSFEDAYAASCRVCVNGARGTGWFAGSDDKFAYVITNHHVVTSNQSARLDFWSNGKMQSVNGSVCLRAYNPNMPADFACIAVNANELKAIDPPFIALAGADARPSVGAFIVSAGAPDGRFVQAWKGQVLEYYNGKTAVFSPPPVPGQSGSAICEFVDGELFATGILTWLIGSKGSDDSRGGAIPISNLYRAISTDGAEVDYETISPIPPDATECVDSSVERPCVLFFTQPNCPPCVQATKEAKAIKEALVNIYSVDASTPKGGELAVAYGVERTPTYIVVNVDNEKVAEFVGTNIVDDVVNAYKCAMSDSCPVNLPEPKTSNDDSSGASSGFSPPVKGGAVAPSSSAPLVAPPVNNPPSFSISPPQNSSARFDFRNRSTVYDLNVNTGFFEDSNNRWNNRKKNKEDSPTEPADEGTRIAGKAIDKAAESLIKSAEQMIARKESELKETIKNFWASVKFAFYASFIASVVVSVISADAIKTILKAAIKKTVSFLSAIRKAMKSNDQ